MASDGDVKIEVDLVYHDPAVWEEYLAGGMYERPHRRRTCGPTDTNPCGEIPLTGWEQGMDFLSFFMRGQLVDYIKSYKPKLNYIMRWHHDNHYEFRVVSAEYAAPSAGTVAIIGHTTHVPQKLARIYDGKMPWKFEYDGKEYTKNTPPLPKRELIARFSRAIGGGVSVNFLSFTQDETVSPDNDTFKFLHLATYYDCSLPLPGATYSGTGKELILRTPYVDITVINPLYEEPKPTVKWAWSQGTQLIRAEQKYPDGMWMFTWPNGEDRLVAPTLNALGSHLSWYDTFIGARGHGVSELLKQSHELRELNNPHKE